MNIMFICTGNICRSAMAHGLLEKKLQDNNITNVNVYSCGIYAESGISASFFAIEEMKNYNVDLSKHKSVNINKSNILKMDLILCASSSHKELVLMLYPDLKGKVYTIKEYVNYDKKYHNKTDIEDPWGYGEEEYRFCAEEINECLDLLINKIQSIHKKD